MRYFLPPPGPSPVRRQIPRIRELGALEHSTDPVLDRGAHPDDSGRLARVRRLEAGTSDDYLGAWAGEAPVAEPIAARPGISAAERRRADTTLGVGPGGPIVRRQRLAVVEVPGGALAAHWSAIEPVGAEDDRAWERLLDRLAGEAAGQRGWTA